MSVRVKICGVTRTEDALAAMECGADMIGINFYAPSPRAVSLERAREIREVVPDAHKLVGIFVNESREFVTECLEAVQLDLLQFHGDEADSFLTGWPVPVIRALRLQTGQRFDPSEHASSIYVLLDTFHPALYGGTGAKRTLSDLRGVNLSRVFISGGLNPDNVREAVELSPYAVDVASGVEQSPGIKDHDKLRRFIRNAKSAR
ncbi:MAG TPA: phosphoribosylanthranilate isomerase [Candidatus Binataceae bacterium]|nr:phosphoribosylanthranilate isomerase [Candidatus Binataceae bacterium]